MYSRLRKVHNMSELVAYEYEIQGNYGYGWDMLTTESSMKEARAQLVVYGNNEDVPLRIKRVKAGA